MCLCWSALQDPRKKKRTDRKGSGNDKYLIPCLKEQGTEKVRKKSGPEKRNSRKEAAMTCVLFHEKNKMKGKKRGK